MKEKLQKNKKIVIWSAIVAAVMYVLPMACLAGRDVGLFNSFIGLSMLYAFAVFVLWGRYKLSRI